MAPSQHAPTLGEVQAFLGTSARTSLLIHLSRTQPCPLYLHPTPWHSWRKLVDVWKRFPNPPNRGEDLFCKHTACLVFTIVGMIMDVPYPDYNFLLPGIQHQAFKETRAMQCLSRLELPLSRTRLFKQSSKYSGHVSGICSVRPFLSTVQFTPCRYHIPCSFFYLLKLLVFTNLQGQSSFS